jgi:hypothetical protein
VPEAVEMQAVASSGVRKLDWAGGVAVREVDARWGGEGVKACVPVRRVRMARVEAFMVGFDEEKECRV